MRSVEDHFNNIAGDYDKYKKKNRYYYENLKKLLANYIEPGKKVLEVGCGTGDLLISLNPSVGYGTDISNEMIKIAKSKYKSKNNIHFSTKSVNRYKNIKPDYIFMSDVSEHLENPQKMLKNISSIMTSSTVFINTYANPLWEPVLLVAEKLGLKMPEGKHKRYCFSLLKQYYQNAGLKITEHNRTLLAPAKFFGLSDIINRYLSDTLNKICFIEYVVAKKK